MERLRRTTTHELQLAAYEARVDFLRAEHRVVYPLNMPDPSLLSHEGNSLHQIARTDGVFCFMELG